MKDKVAWVNSAGISVVFKYEVWYLSSLTLHTPAARTDRPQLGRCRNGQATFLLFLKHLLCSLWERSITLLIISLSVSLSFLWINLLEFSETPFHSILKTIWRDLWVFEVERKRLEIRALCFPTYQLASSTLHQQVSVYLFRRLGILNQDRHTADSYRPWLTLKKKGDRCACAGWHVGEWIAAHVQDGMVANELLPPELKHAQCVCAY